MVLRLNKKRKRKQHPINEKTKRLLKLWGYGNNKKETEKELEKEIKGKEMKGQVGF